jgi:hypothetical protein
MPTFRLTALVVISVIKETKGRSLEDMDILFGTVDEAQRRADVEQVLEKTRVTHDEDTPAH